jgi:hypothetical protein
VHAVLGHLACVTWPLDAKIRSLHACFHLFCCMLVCERSLWLFQCPTSSSPTLTVRTHGCCITMCASTVQVPKSANHPYFNICPPTAHASFSMHSSTDAAHHCSTCSPSTAACRLHLVHVCKMHSKFGSFSLLKIACHVMVLPSSVIELQLGGHPWKPSPSFQLLKNKQQLN